MISIRHIFKELNDNVRESFFARVSMELTGKFCKYEANRIKSRFVIRLIEKESSRNIKIVRKLIVTTSGHRNGMAKLYILVIYDRSIDNVMLIHL